MGLSPEARRRSDELVLGSYAFACELARLSDEASLHQLIVDTMAKTVKAQQAGLAVFDDKEGSLLIVGTHGYPAPLVEHVRIAPGTGIMGGIFSSRSPLLVSDISQEGMHRPPRPRYRTPSFVAVPLIAGGEVMGVLSLADRADGKPFDKADLTAVRALAAPAALALAGQRLAKQKRELEVAAAIDPLTGLFNRRYFQARLEEEIGRAHRYGLDLTLAIVDLDQFKELNDTLGHPVGDAVLRDVADILRRSIRIFDVCTRYGGDEFVILFPGSGASSATQSAERIRQRLESYRASASHGVPADVRLTASIGLAVLPAGASAPELLAQADRALYQAKAAGRNCVQLATE